MLLWLLHLLGDFLAGLGLYRFFGILDQLQFRALAAAALSFFIVVALGRRTIRWLRSMNIGDTGSTDAELLKAQATSKANTPTMGGILIVGAIAGSVLLLGDLSNSYIHLGLVVLIWLAVVGGADDYLKLTTARRSGGRQGLYAWEKLAFQIGIGLIVGYFAFNYGASPQGAGHALNLPFQKTYLTANELAQLDGLDAAERAAPVLNPAVVHLGRAAFIVLTILMVAGLSNAVNITDGMDGLAAGVTIAVAVGLAILAAVAGDSVWAGFLLVPAVPGAAELTVLAGAMVGACLGFLWWNCSPAQVFMGDTGALPLGGLIGYIAIVTRQEFVVLVMCGVFLLEIASVVAQVGYFKITGGRRVFKCAPFHHHLHFSGWTEQQVVARAWIIAVILVVLALATIKVR